MADIVINPSLGKIDFFTVKGEQVTNSMRLIDASTILFTGPLSASAISTGGGGAFVTSVQPTSNYLSKFTGNSTIANSLVYDNGTNVGIGTTSPIFKFQVVGSAYVNNGTLYIDSGNSLTWGNSTQSILGTNDVGLYFTAGSATRLFISSSGNIGIGTTTTAARLHVNSTTSGATLLRTDGTNGTLFSVVDDLSDSLMSVNNSAGLPVLEVFADDRIVGGQYGQNDFVVVNNKIGIGTNNPTAKLQITSSTSTPSAAFLGGNVGIGTTSPSGKLHVYDNGGSFRTDLDATYHMGILNEYVSTYVTRTKFGRWNNTSNLEIYYDIAGLEEARITRNFGQAVLKFNRSSTTDMIIDGSGNVGIGTTSPSSTKLHIVGDWASGHSTVKVQGITDNTTGYGFYDTVGSRLGYLAYTGAAFEWYNNANVPIIFYTNTSEKMRIASGGNVGIGTTSPSSKLHIDDATAPWITISRSGTPTWQLRNNYPSNQYGFSFNNTTAGTVPLFIGAGGNIGIGLDSPSVKLDIASTQGDGIVMRYDTSTAYQAWIRPYWNSGTDTRIDFAINRSANVTPTVIMSVGYGSNVGIGTTAPAYKLDVVSGSMRAATGAYAGELYFGTVDNENVYLKRDNNYDLSLVQNAASGNALYLASAGNVYISIDSNNNGTTDAFIVQNNSVKSGTELFRVNESGCVGIGTSSPSAKFEIGAGSNNVVVAKLTQGYERVRYYGFDLLGYNDGTLWMIGNNASNGLILGSSWDWDYQVGIYYTPGTAGAAGGTLEIGQLTKNNANYTHGNTRFYTNGIERMRITSNGRIGIGASSPETLLQVGGETLINYTNAILTVQGGSGYGFIRMYGNNSSVEMQIDSHSSNSNAGTVGTYTNHPVYIKTNNSTKISILAGGNVGIGTTAPSATLTVITTNDTGSRIQLGTASTSAYMNANLVNDFMVLTAPYGANAASVSNGGAKWGIKMNGSIDNINIKSKSACIYAVSEETDTGYNRRIGLALHTSGFDLDNTERVRINSVGNVGIGTTNPDVPLYVLRGSGDSTATFKAASGGAEINLDATNGYAALKLYASGTEKWRIGQVGDSTGFQIFQGGIGNRVYINSSGNVGIGSTSPAYKFDLYDGNQDVARFYNNQTTFGLILGSTANTSYTNLLWTTSTGNAQFFKNRSSTSWGGADSFNFYTSNGGFAWHPAGTTNALYLTTAGNVGIGTTSPTEKLNVIGNGFFTDNSLFNYKIQRIPQQGNPQGGTYKGYLILAKAYTSGLVNASYVIGNVVLRRGTSGTGHNVDIYYVNSSTGYNTDIFQVTLLGSIGTRFSRLVKVTYGGVIYHAIETVNTGGSPSTELEFNGCIVDSPLIFTDESYVSNVTAYGSPVMFVDQNANVGIGTTSPIAKLETYGGSMDPTLTPGDPSIFSVNSLGVQLAVGRMVTSPFSVWLQGKHATVGGGLTYPMVLNPLGGCVGIGTTSPSSKLDVYTNGTSNYISNRSDGADGSIQGITFVGGIYNRAIISSVNESTNGGYLTFQTYTGGNGSERMRITSGGNVGIGTTSPNTKFHVVGNADIGDSTADTGIIIRHGAGSAQYGRLRFYDSNGLNVNTIHSFPIAWQGGTLLNSSAGAINLTGYNGVTFGSWNSVDVAFASGGTNYFKGNVGIGISTPSAVLNIRASAPTSTGTVTTGTNLLIDSNTSNYITFRNTADNGTYAGLTFLDNNTGGYVVFRNYTGDVATGSDSMIYGTYQDHIFQNGSSETINGKTETMRIKGNGNVGIGTNNPGYKLQVNSGGIAYLAAQGNALVMGDDATYGASGTGRYVALGYGGLSNGANKIFAHNTGEDGIYICSATSRNINFRPGGGATDYVVITSVGNVGIGTTSVTDKLSIVNGNISLSDSYKLYNGSSNDSVGIYFSNTLQANIAGYNGIIFRSSATNISSQTERMRITNGGNVGIGTTSPSASLQINSTTAGATLLRTDGTNGTLFSVVDDLSDSLMSVNNSAGLPVLEVFADDRIVGGQYGQNDFVVRNNRVGIGTNNPLAKLHVSGSNATSIIDGLRIGRGSGDIITNTAVGSDALRVNTTGRRNTAVGYRSMYTNIGGEANTAFGYNSMYYNTNGYNNTAVGYRCLESNTSGANNTAFGYSSLKANTTGTANSAFGYLALASNIITSKNSAFGYKSLQNHVGAEAQQGPPIGEFNSAFGVFSLTNSTSGEKNCAFGYKSLYQNNSGINNSAFGYTSLQNNTTGFSNSAFGNRALWLNTGGAQNCAFGGSALNANTFGQYNNAFGSAALLFNQIGNNNNAVGYLALRTNTTSNNNAFGYKALYANTTGIRNSAFGHRALDNNTIGTANSAFGYYALKTNTTGSGSVAIGYGALYSNTTGRFNVAVGALSSYKNTFGYGNTALGYQSLFNNATATANTAIGYRAMANTTGYILYNCAFGPFTLENAQGAAFGADYNTAVGYNALQANTTGGSNVAVGYQALTVNKSGASNVAVGNNALGGNVTSAPSKCVAVGDSCMFNAGASPSNSTAVGTRALYSASGANNTAFGYSAGSAITTGTNLTVIGYNAAASSATATNEVTLGNSSVATLRCQVTTITALSDFRDKTDINDIQIGLSFVEKLRPVTFKWDRREWYTDGNRDGSKKDSTIQAGFIAQELKQLQEEEGVEFLKLVYESNPDKLEATPGNLMIPLIKAVQELSIKVKFLENKIVELESK